MGADRRSLAFLPFLRPDVIKLDLRLIQDRPSREVAEVAGAVSAAAERTGSAVLAGGIETPEHLDVARALGARLGQGYLFGRPGEVSPVAPAPARAIPLRELTAPAAGATPFASVARLRPPRRSTKPLLWKMSKLLESQAADLGAAGVVLAAFQDEAFFTPATARRYAAMAERLSLVAALGRSLEARPGGAFRGASLAPGDPLLDEWSVVAVGPHFAGALVARDLGDDGPDAARRFDFVLTYDRALVLEAARAAMARVAPE